MNKKKWIAIISFIGIATCYVLFMYYIYVMFGIGKSKDDKSKNYKAVAHQWGHTYSPVNSHVRTRSFKESELMGVKQITRVAEIYAITKEIALQGGVPDVGVKEADIIMNRLGILWGIHLTDNIENREGTIFYPTFSMTGYGLMGHLKAIYTFKEEFNDENGGLEKKMLEQVLDIYLNGLTDEKIENFCSIRSKLGIGDITSYIDIMMIDVTFSIRDVECIPVRPAGDYVQFK